jgi:hypothetical protein
LVLDIVFISFAKEASIDLEEDQICYEVRVKIVEGKVDQVEVEGNEPHHHLQTNVADICLCLI